MKRTPLDFSAQILLPSLTIAGQIGVALKYPQWGLIINLAAQPFWVYSSWKAYKEAKQIGILITTIIMTTVTAFGVINYWLIK
jgi:hypothetical protein